MIVEPIILALWFGILCAAVLGAAAPLIPTQIATPSDALKMVDGTRYVVLKKGGGTQHAAAANDVTITARGWWAATGKPIDSPDLQGKPYTYHLRHLIRGWQDAVAIMVPGETARFWMPASVTGSKEHGNASGAMIFEIHLISVRRHEGAEERPGMN